MALGNDTRSREVGELVREIQGLTGGDLRSSLTILRENLGEDRMICFPSMYRKEWDYLVREGRAFGWWLFQAAVAAQFAFAQLLANTKRLLVFGLIPQGVGVVLTTHNAALGAADPVVPGNLLTGGAGPDATANLGTQAAAIPGTRIARFPVAGSLVFPGAGGLIAEIAPGRNLLVSASTVNVALEAMLWFAEVDGGQYP